MKTAPSQEKYLVTHFKIECSFFWAAGILYVSTEQLESLTEIATWGNVDMVVILSDTFA